MEAEQSIVPCHDDDLPVYVTLHEKTKHNALDINLRYRPEQLSGVIIIDFHFLAWIDRGIIPLQENLLRTFQNTILTKLWLEEVSRVATQSVHDMDQLLQATMAAANTKVASPFYSSILCTNKPCLLILFHRHGGCRRFGSLLGSSLTLQLHIPLSMVKQQYGIWAIRVYFGSYLHDYRGQRLQICRSSNSKVIHVVGNGGLNSKSIVSALCLVLSWKVTYICGYSSRNRRERRLALSVTENSQNCLDHGARSRLVQGRQVCGCCVATE